MSTTPSARERPVVRYGIHWHVVLTHFPIAFFVASAGLMFLHLLMRNPCFDLGSYAMLIGGAAAMVPVTLTGWFTWKGRYRGLRSSLFLNKVRISFAMLGISLLLVIYHTILLAESMDIMGSVWHTVYFIGTVLLVIGAMAEGYYGGRLNHR